MSRSFGVKILLPMDKYNSDEVYTADERLEKVSSDKEDGKYYKTLKIRSTYASSTDIRAYLIEKYGLSEEDFRNYSASYRFGYCNYHFGNGKEMFYFLSTLLLLQFSGSYALRSLHMVYAHPAGRRS